MCLKIFHTEVVYDMLHWGSTKAVPPCEVRVLPLSRMAGREPSPYENISVLIGRISREELGTLFIGILFVA